MRKKINKAAGGKAVCDYHQTFGLMHFSRAVFPKEASLCLYDPSPLGTSDDGDPALCSILVGDV